MILKYVMRYKNFVRSLNKDIKIDISDNLSRMLYDYFENEWLDNNILWTEFIRSKDLGLEYNPNEKHKDVYTVIDSHKWMLAKIKYGF